MSAGDGDDAGQVARALAVLAWRHGDGGLARITGPESRAAAALVTSWRRAGAEGERAAGDVAEALAAPRPAAWQAIDPSWLDAAGAAAGLGRAMGVAVAGDGPVERWCARWLFGDLVPMSTGLIPASPGPRDLARLPAPALVSALAWLGRRQLVHALGAGLDHALAPLAAVPPWGRELLIEAVAVARMGQLAVARLGTRRGALARTAGLVSRDSLAPMRLGARAIAATVRPLGDLAAQLAQRLPRPIGLILADELAGDHGPAVAAEELTLAIRRVA